jgi:hypothetical protein
VTAKLFVHFSSNRRFEDRDSIMEIILGAFRQVGRASVAASEAAAESEEVVCDTDEESREARENREFDFE